MNTITYNAWHPRWILIGVITIGGLIHEQEIKEFFSNYAPETMKSYQKYLRQTLDMALEVLDVNLKMKKGNKGD